ncbi:MAG: serine/threonine protein kinase [Cystobacterineae bacterium]|nr:serine/threonine protein kinase [Cystobacterineae bacterium]
MISALVNTTVSFDRFWRWMVEHPHCILRIGCAECTLFDHENFHWEFSDEEGHAIVQVLLGKQLIGEMAIERSEVLCVQASIDTEEADKGLWLFEIMAGTKEEPFLAWHFLMAHNMEHIHKHAILKH